MRISKHHFLYGLITGLLGVFGSIAAWATYSECDCTNPNTGALEPVQNQTATTCGSVTGTGVSCTTTNGNYFSFVASGCTWNTYAGSPPSGTDSCNQFPREFDDRNWAP